MPETNLNELTRWRRDLGKQSAERQKLTRALGERGRQLRTLEAEIAGLTARGESAAVQARQAEREQLMSARRADVARLGLLDDAIRDALGRGAAQLDPADADPSLPLLLLPVRIETRFTTDGASLRVRIFPDDVHIDALDRGVSESESAAGMAYWNAVWHASEEEAGTAWRTLLEKVGKLRARWVALALQPTNLPSREADAAPEFGDLAPRTRRAAVARLLPDVFTAVAIQGESRSARTGRVILPEVTVGLYANDGSELRDVNGVKVIAGAEWLVDYEEAERIGMAITVPLRQPRAKVDRLFVFGVRRSLDPHDTSGELAALFDAHRCTQGLAFAPQGTPTNNTETDRAGWQRRIEPRPPARAAVAAPPARSNAAVLATALGVDPHTFADLDHAADEEQSRASAMNVALWGPSWGGFLEKVNRVTRDGATLSDRTREDTRGFHRDFLRGRGPLPALRIGSQPYGIVPVSSVARRWQSNRGDTFEAGLLPLLQRLRERWRKCLPNVPRVGVGPIDDTLRELLGSSAVSVALRVRTVLSEEMAQIAPNITDAAKTDLEVERMIDELIFEEVIANASLVRRTGSLGESRPLSLVLVHESDPAFIAALLAGSSQKAESVFQALIALAWDRARRDVDQDGAGGRYAEIVRNATTLSAIDREKTLAVASRADTADATTLFAEAQRLSGLMAAPPPTHAEFQPIAALSRSFGELSLQSTSESARADLGLFGAYAWLNSRGRFNELRAALAELESTGLDERRILFAETLDLASHRLDAWITAVVERRRRSLRTTRPDGLTVGAYGWVEDIEPAGDRQLNGGFVHTPSLTHAATAGVLRSAYLSHNDVGGQGAFAVDLASSRVRTALHLADGVRQGQPLAGLLGYKIERRLHEVELDRFVLSLRTIAPFSQGKLTDRGETVPAAAVEALAAANVVDGLELVEKYQGKVKLWDPARIRSELDTKPKDNPYLTGPWPKLTDVEWTNISGIIEEAAFALDAVGDLLLAESVHQLVSGSTARAAAALDAASSGESPPPQPDVIATPAEGIPFTHRVMLVAGDGAPWNTSRPRSMAEPGLEAWAAARLGSPETIVVADGADGELITMADTGLCALDAVYESADRASFDARVRAALPTVSAVAAFHETRAAGWTPELRAIGDVFECAASLRALLVRARPAVPSDFAIPNFPATRGPTAVTLQAALDRARAARDLLGLRCTMLEALLAGGAASPGQLRSALEALAAVGLGTPAVSEDQLLTIAQAMLASGARRLQTADAALALPLTAEIVVQAGQAIFGEGFWILPAIDVLAGSDAWDAALTNPPPGASATAVRRQLIDLASVRDGARRFVEATLLVEAIGAAAPSPRVVQLAGLGGIPPSRWIGGPLGPEEPTPNVPVVSTVLDLAGAYGAGSPTVALIVDEWVDVIPLRARRGPAEDAPIDERVTTGVTFNAMAASARAPQAMLLAVSPDGARWTANALLDTLEDTLELAQLRAVTLERTNGIARIIPALYEQSWSLQGEQVLDLNLTVQEVTMRSLAGAYVQEAKP